MSNMDDITKKHSTEIYKDEQHGRHHQKTWMVSGANESEDI
jgi:hypothetical protein